MLKRHVHCGQLAKSKKGIFIMDNDTNIKLRIIELDEKIACLERQQAKINTAIFISSIGLLVSGIIVAALVAIGGQ